MPSRKTSIRDNELAWFTDYFTNREQTTIIDGVKSSACPVTLGVPQGSILGPLLFIIFINDFPSVVTNCEVFLYADDTAIMYSAKNDSEIERVINQDLELVSTWMNTNKLSLNASKTKSMTFGSSHMIKSITPLYLKLDNITLENVSVFKYLGIWFDPCLKWNVHIDKIAAKISQKLGILKRLSWCVDQFARNILYNSLILPHIDYCSPVWTTAADKLVNRIQVLQNRAARLVLGRKLRDSHVTDMFAELKWLQVRQRGSYFRNTLMYKCVNGLAPDYLTKNTVLQKNAHSHRTRSSCCNNVLLAPVKTECGKRSFKFSGGSSWNCLPPNMKVLPTLSNFKINLRSHLLCTNV